MPIVDALSFAFGMFVLVVRYFRRGGGVPMLRMMNRPIAVGR